MTDLADEFTITRPERQPGRDHAGRHAGADPDLEDDERQRDGLRVPLLGQLRWNDRSGQREAHGREQRLGCRQQRRHVRSGHAAGARRHEPGHAVHRRRARRDGEPDRADRARHERSHVLRQRGPARRHRARRHSAVTQIPGTNIYRYYFAKGTTFGPGTVTITFGDGAWSDSAGTSSESTGTFTIVAPATGVSAPVNVPQNDPAASAPSVDVNAANGTVVDYIDVTFATSLGTLDASSIDGNEFTIAATGTGTITPAASVDGTPVLVSGSTYRYFLTLTGNVTGVTLTPVAGGWTFNNGAAQNATTASAFSSVSAIQTAHYVDVVYTPANGGTLDYTTIYGTSHVTVNGTNLSGPLAIEMITDADTGIPTATYVSEAKAENDHVTLFRYLYTGQWQAGTAVVDVPAWADTSGTAAAATVFTFNVTGATATVTNPTAGNGVDINTLNGRTYVDVPISLPRACRAAR